MPEADGTAEHDATLMMLAQVPDNHRITLGADEAYDAKGFAEQLRELTVTRHIAQKITAHRGSNLDGRTTRHAGYAVSLRKRKRIEEVFGWLKMVAGLRKTRHRGVARVGWC